MQKEEMATVVSMKADLDKNTFVKEEEYKKYFAVVQVDKEIVPQMPIRHSRVFQKRDFI